MPLIDIFKTARDMSKNCGICGIYPRWLRNRATPRNFIAVYGLLGTVQAMAFIYIVVTLTTLEKRFKIPSRTTGRSYAEAYISLAFRRVIIISFDDVGLRFRTSTRVPLEFRCDRSAIDRSIPARR
jgi:hypothetical protein